MIRAFRLSLSHLAPAALILLTLTGCSGRVVPPIGQTVSLHMQGKVHGGQQPVAGASIQLFDIDAGTLGNGALPLINTTVLSDANGNFNITGDYVCPNGTDQVYLAAIGGNPGGGTNADLVMMTALGNCSSLSTTPFISVNEVTTVATVWTYIEDYDTGQVGGANVRIEFGGEYQNFLNLVDPATGVALATNGSEVQLEMNALANSLSTCVNSSTEVNGDSPACDGLVNAAGQSFSPAVNDSSEAAYAIAVNQLVGLGDPAAVYMDAPASGPFQPTLTSAPTSWDLGFAPFD